MLQTTTYIQHQRAGSGTLLEVSDFMTSDGRPSNQAAAISIMIVRLYIMASVIPDVL